MIILPRWPHNYFSRPGPNPYKVPEVKRNNLLLHRICWFNKGVVAAGWRRFTTTFCCGDQAVVSARPTRGGCTQHVFGLRRPQPPKAWRLYPGLSILGRSHTRATRRPAPGKTVAHSLREAQLGPLTGTSANIAGREECHTAAEVLEQLGDAVDLIVDAPVAAADMPSTIVDCTRPSEVRVLRVGAISRETIASALAGAATLS